MFTLPPMPASAWSDWQPLAFDPPLRDASVLTEVLDGGQAFRWVRQPDDTWVGVWDHCVAQVRWTPAGAQWRAPSALASTAAPSIARYFGLGDNQRAAVDALPWRSDPHLARCLQEFAGLRILRQPFGETLLGFLCSATKQIVQIKQMLALLATRHGRSLFRLSTLNPQLSTPLNRLPTWPELAEIPEADLRACLLGFRARYIHETAVLLAQRPGWLEETEALPYPEAKERLCTLPGVGEKVADCVLLFGAGRLEAFPVDVWILKSMAQRYGLNGWKPAQVAHFGRIHFGASAGLAQQFLFAWERRAAKAKIS
jgi:N-glycosylase/DNA lyase